MAIKNCHNPRCGRGFGLFAKKFICQACSQAFCDRCVKTGESFPAAGILPQHRLCVPCLDNLRASASNSPKKDLPTVNLNDVRKPQGDPSAIDRELEEMMEEQQFPLNVRESTRNLDLGQKWTLIQGYRQSLVAEKNEKNQHYYWVEKLQNLSSQIWKESDKMNRFLNTIKSQTKTWMTQFLRDKGLSALIEGFHACKNNEIRVIALKALSAIISTEIGLQSFLQLPAAFPPLILTTMTSPDPVRHEIFSILAFTVSADLDNGYRYTMEAFMSQQTGRIPFKFLIDLLIAPQTEQQVRFAIMVLINALVNAPDLLEDRQHTRQVLITAGLHEAISVLRNSIANARVASDGAASQAQVSLSPPTSTRSTRLSMSGPRSGASNAGISNNSSNQLSLSSISESSSIPNSSSSPQIASNNNIQTRGGTISINPTVGTATNKIVDHSEIWELIRIQIELYEISADEDSIDSTRSGLDFSSIEQLLEYVRTQMAPSVGQFLLPLLQMVVVLPQDTIRGGQVWNSILTVVKHVISADKSGELLTYDQLFDISESFARQATMDVNQSLMEERNAMEKQLNDLRTVVHNLEKRLAQSEATAAAAAGKAGDVPPPPPESESEDVSKLKQEIQQLQTKIQQLETQGSAVAAAASPAPTVDPQLQSKLDSALRTIAQLEAQVAQYAANAASGAGAAAGGAMVEQTVPVIATDAPPAPASIGSYQPQPARAEMTKTIKVAGGAAPAAAAPATPVMMSVLATDAPAAPASIGSYQPQPERAPLMAMRMPPAGAAGAAAAAGGAAAAPEQPKSIIAADAPPAPASIGSYQPQPARAPLGGAAAPAAGAASGASGDIPPAPIIKGYYSGPGGAAATSASAPAVKKQEAPPPPKVNLPYEKKKITPKVKMRAFHWSRVDEKIIENTIWYKLNDERNIKLDIKDLEEKFCQRAANPNAAGPAADAPKPVAQPKQELISFVDGQRGQNMAIAISRFRPLTHEQLRDAVLAMDTNTLSLENLSSMEKWLPTPEEVEAVNSFDGSVNDLAQVDRYIMIISKIPDLQRRLTVIMFRIQYENLQKDLKQKISLCLEVLHRLKNSKALLRVFEYVLAIGNYLNGGTNRGGAYGFHISFLTRLQDTKTADNSSNMLQYLLSLVDKDSEAASFQESLEGVSEAVRIELPMLLSEVAKFQANVNISKGLLATAEKRSIPGDKSVQILGPFVTQVEPMAKMLTEEVAKISAVATELAKGYGEDPSKFGADAIFGLFNEFNLQINRTRADLKRIEEMKEKQEKLAKAAEDRKGGPAGRPGGRPPMMGFEGADGANALQLALQQRKERAAAPPPAQKSPTNEPEMATKVQATLTGKDSQSIMNQIKARRDERSQQQGKRQSIFSLGGAPPPPS